MHVHAEGQRGVPAGKAALRDDEVVQRDDAEAAQLFRDRSQEVPALLDRGEAFEREARVAVVPRGMRGDLGRELVGERGEARAGLGSGGQLERHLISFVVGGSDTVR